MPQLTVVNSYSTATSIGSAGTTFTNFTMQQAEADKVLSNVMDNKMTIIKNAGTGELSIETHQSHITWKFVQSGKIKVKTEVGPTEADKWTQSATQTLSWMKPLYMEQAITKQEADETQGILPARKLDIFLAEIMRTYDKYALNLLISDAKTARQHVNFNLENTTPEEAKKKILETVLQLVRKENFETNRSYVDQEDIVIFVSPELHAKLSSMMVGNFAQSALLEGYKAVGTLGGYKVVSTLELSGYSAIVTTSDVIVSSFGTEYLGWAPKDSIAGDIYVHARVKAAIGLVEKGLVYTINQAELTVDTNKYPDLWKSQETIKFKPN
ncbi:hypothetical protein [Mycoplasmopsis sturni]|uniref:hypothetical protein n=1 Tax=Mycoplasmopsis sturni TaxID=39047 RepID=UPI00055B763B|nr:hypothetical protein [Mycoplasmopsis sturni]